MAYPVRATYRPVVPTALVLALLAAHLLALVWALERGARDGDRGWWLVGWLLLGPLLPLAALGGVRARRRSAR